jgi:hypothetical protein
MIENERIDWIERWQGRYFLKFCFGEGKKTVLPRLATGQNSMAHTVSFNCSGHYYTSDFKKPAVIKK